MEAETIPDYEIIIVGAGIAGLVAARAVARQEGISLAIVERNDVAFHNPTPLTFTAVVENHGLNDCCKEIFSSFIFHNFKGSSVEFFFGEYPLVALDYKKACQKLWQQINSYQDKPTFICRPAEAIFSDKNCVRVKLKGGDELSGEFLIDSTGKTQLAAQGLKKGQPSWFSHVYGGYFSRVENRGKKLCCFLLPNKEFGSGGGWFYSIGPREASFGYATISSSPDMDSMELQGRFQNALRKFSPYNEMLRSANLEQIETGVIPITHASQFVNERVIIIGDAAGMATNWTCMGVEPALKYGHLAGVLSSRAVANRDYGILREIQKIWKNDDQETYKRTGELAPKFWNSDPYFWEWIIKNDLLFLSPRQVVERLRWNKHLLKSYQAFAKALGFKIKAFFNKGILEPKQFTKRENPDPL